MGSKAKRQLLEDRAKRHQKIHDGYCARHPARAREERSFRKEQRQRQRDHRGRDLLRDTGTPETKAKAAEVRQGSLARMYEAGQLTIEQLASAQQIRGVAERLGRDVGFGSFSLETRVDQSRSGTGAFFEALGAVRAEVAYRRWCEWMKRGKHAGAPQIAMIVDELPVSHAARRWGMRNATARKHLSAALDEWSDIMGVAVRDIEEADLLAMHAGLL